MNMHTALRTTWFRIRTQLGYTVLISILLAGLLWTPPGCKRSGDDTPKAGSGGRPAAPRPANVTGADTTPQATPVPSDAAKPAKPTSNSPSSHAAPVRSDSPFFPAEEVVKVALDNEPLSQATAYEALVPALVRFLDSATETDFPRGTAVMRPAIHLDTATYRISYMLVPGEPAVKCYMPDRSMPWLFGDDEAYEQLFNALERLSGRKLPRE